MQKMLSFLLCLFLSIFVFCPKIHAQQNAIQFDPAREAVFKDALTRYVRGDYSAAFRQFEELATSQTVHHRMTASLLMVGKSLYKLERYAEALPYYERLLTVYPQSGYADDAHYARAEANYRLQQNLQAANDLLTIVDNSRSDAGLMDKSKRLVNYIMRIGLSEAELRGLLRSTTGEGSQALVSLALARKLMLAGDQKTATDLLNGYKARFGNSAYSEQITDLLNDAANLANSPVRVGVILPLSGLYGQEGLSILRGIRFAQNNQTNGSENQIQLVIHDSESNLIKALGDVKNLMHRENVRVVIGELESSVTAAVGALAAVEDIPVVAPAATENGVASVGGMTFQLNSDLEQKGSALAHFAIEELGMHAFATLAPSDEYGQQIVASFTATVDKLGGRIIAQTWYYGTPEDLSRQFTTIRESAFRQDSTDVFGLLREARKRGENLEANDIAVTSIDGFFIPVSYPEDLKYIAPQMALNNVRSQILGGESFDDISVLQEQQVQRYINGATFVSDYFPNEEDRQFRDFRTNFRLKMRKTPERWEVFGYDAYQIILSAIQAGARTSSEIYKKLNNLENYKGMKGLISFKGNNRVNNAVSILQFINGRIVKRQNEVK